ncbi:sugar phosphate isomerase/epimerase [soil metagenome]
MFILSAFADEISPDPAEQIAVLKSANVRHIEFRSIHKTNCLKLSEDQLQEFQARLDDEGMKLSAIGSPIGKYPIDQPFGPHFDLFKRAVDLADRFRTPHIRIFSYYPPENGWNGDWSPYREEILNRMRAKAEYAEANGVRLFHENEHKIYGDSPDRVLDLFENVKSPALRAAYDAANFVFCGYCPTEGWNKTKHFTSHLHIKDWKAGGEEHTGRIAGTGDGKIPNSTWDAVQMGYQGFAVLEPHLRGGGPTGGVTGSDLFPLAVEAFRNILRVCGGVEKY